jgi:hypothetical protein
MRHELFPITISKSFHLSKDENAKTGQNHVNARTAKCAAHFKSRPDFALLNGDDCADWNFGKEFSRSFPGQTNAAV